VKELVLAREGEALELKVVEEVQGQEHQELVTSQAFPVPIDDQLKDLERMDGTCPRRIQSNGSDASFQKFIECFNIKHSPPSSVNTFDAHGRAELLVEIAVVDLKP
jgi:hypothetical protein